MKTTPIRLDRWVELTGILQRVSTDESYVYLEIADKLLIFPRESAASATILSRISQRLIGKRIGVLSTDSVDRPIVVRVFGAGAETLAYDRKKRR